MEVTWTKRTGLLLAMGLLCLQAGVAQHTNSQEVPSNFGLDTEKARLSPQREAQSSAPEGQYSIGGRVLERLVQQILPASTEKILWQLRIVTDGQFNAYSSADGAIYVESGLAKIAGSNAGLWAAILSHEMAHIVRHDSARRRIYEKYLEREGSATIVLGDPSLPSAGAWSDSEKASADMGRFCREMELDADRHGLLLMAHAGYHPDFVPALHHLLHAHGSWPTATSIYAMHPCWEDRDRDLARAYLQASIEFEHRWPEWYASPGGNPPVVVFTEEPTIKKTGSKEWQIQLPMRCQNLVGAVEVVLRDNSVDRASKRSDPFGHFDGAEPEERQLTGCTSPKTTVTFTVGSVETPETAQANWTDVYVLDGGGAVLARTDLPRFRH